MKKSTDNKTSFSLIQRYYLALAVVVIVVFGNTIFNGYNMDDNLVTQNHKYTSKGLAAIGKIFSSSYYSDNDEINFGYRPIVHVSFALEHQFFGESPAVSHLFNLLLYLLSVLLFFKLLINWFGEENIVVSFIAALFFAVHPIHSEVVASIKNRDEILGFLFAILAGIYFEKFLIKRSVLSLIWIALFIIIAMLSKKSIYPIVFVFPVMAVSFRKLNLITIFVVSSALVVPVAVIASELYIIKFFLFFSVPFLTILVSFYNKEIFNFCVQIILKKWINNIYFYSIVSWFFIGLSYFYLDFFYFIISIPFIIAATQKNESIGLTQLIVQVYFIGFVFSKFYLEEFSLILSFMYASYLDFKKRDKILVILSLALVLTVVLLWRYFELGNILLVIALAILSFFYFRKPVIALITIVVLFVFTFMFSKFGFNHFLFGCLALFLVLNWKLPQYSLLRFAPFVVLAAISLLIFLKPNSKTLFNKSNIAFYFKPIEVNDFLGNKRLNNKNFSEGRGLLYFENTLIANHSKSETIATGFSTLGEYFKLMIFPYELSFFYGYAKVVTSNFYDYFVYIIIVLHVGLIFLALWMFYKRPIVSIGIFWYLIAILLFSNWIELVAGMVGERLAFTASAGFCLFIAGVVIWIKPSFSFNKPRYTEYAVFILLMAFGIRSFARCSDWKNPLTLMSNDIEHLNKSVQAHNLLALNLMYEASNNTKLIPKQAIELENEAIVHFQKSIELFPSFFNANFDLARVYIAKSDFVNAKKYLLNAYVLDNENLFVLEELTKTCFELRQVNQVEYFGNKYLQYVPNNENVHELMAYLCLMSNKKQNAKFYAERGLKFFPNNNNLRMVLRDSQVK